MVLCFFIQWERESAQHQIHLNFYCCIAPNGVAWWWWFYMMLRIWTLFFAIIHNHMQKGIMRNKSLIIKWISYKSPAAFFCTRYNFCHTEHFILTSLLFHKYFRTTITIYFNSNWPSVCWILRQIYFKLTVLHKVITWFYISNESRI